MQRYASLPLSDEDVDELVAAETELYASYLASRHPEEGAGLAGIPIEAFQDWLEKRRHHYPARLRPGQRVRLPLHEEAQRFRAHVVAENDSVASSLLGMRRCTYTAWRLQRGHACKTTAQAPLPPPIPAGEVDDFLLAYRRARSDLHGARLLGIHPARFHEERLQRGLPPPSLRMGRRYHTHHPTPHSPDGGAVATEVA